MRNCFVPMCDQTNRDPQRGMFTAPKELFNAWLEALPKSRPFKTTDKVCELHFRPGEVLKTFDQTIKGKLVQIIRDRPKLKPNVIPSQNLPDKNSVKLAKRGRIPNSLKSTNQNIAITPNTKTAKKRNNEELQDDPGSANDEETMIEEVLIQYIQNDELREARERTQILKIEKLDNSVNSHVSELFEALYDEVFEILLPNTLWGFHRCPEKKFIAFTYMDPLLLKQTKCVIINNKNNMSQQLANIIINETTLNDKTCCPEYLSEVLNNVDLIQICCKAYFEENCEIKAMDDSELCFSCSNSA